MSYLSESQIASFRKNGFLVVENVFSQERIEKASKEFHLFLKTALDIDHVDISSSKGLSGSEFAGMVDVYYQEWKMQLNDDPLFVEIMRDLFKGTYASKEAENPDDLFHNPFLPFDGANLFFYIDRANYRLPSKILKTRKLQIHVDSDPKFLYSNYPKNESELLKAAEYMKTFLSSSENGHDNFPECRFKTRWRPIQSFVALTDNPTGNLGGFLCAPGSHKNVCSLKFAHNFPKEFEFTELKDFQEICERIQDISYKRGDVVLWDWRTAHTNSEHHLGNVPREAVYIQCIPDIPLNRIYAKAQLRSFKRMMIPPDFNPGISYSEKVVGNAYSPSDLGRELLGQNIDPNDICASIDSENGHWTCALS
jgi:hypothetical protein